MNLRRLPARAAVAVLTSFVVTGSAIAGLKESARTVVVDLAARTAQGHFSGARATADATQLITCSAYIGDSQPHAEGGISRFTNCVAVDSKGVSAFCWTADSAMLASVLSMTGDSMIYISWNANGHCVSIDVRQSSALEPKR
jgi:hypothetical protein